MDNEIIAKNLKKKIIESFDLIQQVESKYKIFLNCSIIAQYVSFGAVIVLCFVTMYTKKDPQTVLDMYSLLFIINAIIIIANLIIMNIKFNKEFNRPFYQFYLKKYDEFSFYPNRPFYYLKLAYYCICIYKVTWAKDLIYLYKDKKLNALEEQQIFTNLILLHFVEFDKNGLVDIKQQIIKLNKKHLNYLISACDFYINLFNSEINLVTNDRLKENHYILAIRACTLDKRDEFETEKNLVMLGDNERYGYKILNKYSYEELCRKLKE